MTPSKINIGVRNPSSSVAILDIRGEVTNQAETALMEAYNQACEAGARSMVLNFTGLDYMNSSGIGLLVTLLIRAKRLNQKLLAYGLTEHYRQIFELTQLDKAIGICADEASAVSGL